MKLARTPFAFAKRQVAAVACGIAMAMGSIAAVVAGPQVSVYRSTAPYGPPDVDAFSQWLGVPVTLGFDYGSGHDWVWGIAGPDWLLAPWAQWVRAQPGRNLVLSVPMLAGPADRSGPDGIPGTADDVSLAKCAAGQYDIHWTTLANNLAYHGLHWAYLRPGWEMDGGYTWSAKPGSGNEANYAGCFRRIVQVMRAAQPANQWKFIWNPGTADPAYLQAIWPGDAYVDMVGPDIYDHSWAPNTYPYPSGCDAACRLTRQQNAWYGYSELPVLQALRDFAVAHGKPMAIPEWGLVTRSDGHGGGDNPFFMQKMYEFIMDPNNHVVFHAYFDVTWSATDNFRISPPSNSFPVSSPMYKQMFGAVAANAAPKVSITSPGNGQTVSGTIAYAANATDDVAVSRVDFFIDSTVVLRDSNGPYGGSLDTTALADGGHTLKAVAYDAQGASATTQISFTTLNRAPTPRDTTAPSVSLTAPVAGTVIRRHSTVTLAASASDDVGVAFVDFLVNDRLVCRASTAPYRCSWNTGSRHPNSYAITARARDAAGNVSQSSYVYRAAR
jgi:hypothetical protein